MSLRAQRGNLIGQVMNLAWATCIVRLPRCARNDNILWDAPRQQISFGRNQPEHDGLCGGRGISNFY
jgi:hypothetical protein